LHPTCAISAASLTGQPMNHSNEPKAPFQLPSQN
jgi:hypothetical protein